MEILDLAEILSQCTYSSGKSGSAGHHDIGSMHTSAILCCLNAKMGLTKIHVQVCPIFAENVYLHTSYELDPDCK